MPPILNAHRGGAAVRLGRPGCAPCAPRRPNHAPNRLTVLAAKDDDIEDESSEPSQPVVPTKQGGAQEELFPVALGRKTRRALSDLPGLQLDNGPPAPANKELDEINPYVLGRRSRQAFDSVWQQFTRLSSPSSSFGTDADLDFSPASSNEFSTPQASFTTVLVAGATGRTGRILIRKLLLRGYSVKALVRSKEKAAAAGLPTAVQLVEGDVADYKSCRAACEGVDKIMYVATASSAFTSDVARVDADGVSVCAQAFLDSQHVRAARAGVATTNKAKVTLFNFKKRRAQKCWELGTVGVPEEEESWASYMSRGTDVADWGFLEEGGDLVFHGTVYSRGGVAEVRAPMPKSMEGHEALMMNVKGDGKTYTAAVTTAAGDVYFNRFVAPWKFSVVRLPFNFFRPQSGNSPPLDPAAITSVTLRYDQAAQVPGAAAVAAVDGSSVNSFELRVCWIKAVRGAEEPAFVLVSCAGVPRPGERPEAREKRLAFKRSGEEALKKKGMPYTVVRPGTLVAEPGGYKALVFDQGGRISKSVGYADVADVCLRALHDRAASNKSFEVCYEYTPEAGLEMYELVAHLPDKSNNYLTPALAPLEKNT